MDKSKVIVDIGRVADTMVGHDLFNPVHIRYTAVFDHNIDDELIVKAWDRVKRIYPIIDTVLGFEYNDVDFYKSPEFINLMKDPEKKDKYMEGHIYLMKPESGSNNPVKTKVPVAPGTEIVGGRPLCVSYYGNKVAVSMYHAVVDGGGFNMIFCSFLYAYLALYTGHEDENPVVEVTEGRDVKEYYQGATMDYIFSQDYTPTPIFTLPAYCRGFHDRDMENDNGNVYSGNINVSVKDFISFCKANGANPSAAMCAVLAKAAYTVNPEEKNDIVFDLTVSARKALGLEKSVANVISMAVAYATRNEIETKSLGEVSRKIRSDVDSQRSRDYILSFRRMMCTYNHSPLYKSRTVTYIGNLNIGDNSSHIIDFSLETFSVYNLFMMQVNDNFALTLQYGKATEKYLNAIIKVFSELGIKAEITCPAHIVEKDSMTAVL